LERRLAAILAADVAGYSRLMAADEAGTLDRLKALRRDIVDPLIAGHGGRLVKLMGDGALVEFASITQAITCAVEIQRQLAEANAALAADSRIELRIGINLGEVIVDCDDIYGEGVNVAARLEGIAPVGGIAVSGAAYDQARGKVSVGFEAKGAQQVKNIPEPVRVYHVVTGATGASPAPRTGRRPVRVVLVLLAALIAAGLAGWWLTPQTPPELAGPPSAVQLADDRPSIVVLPFANLSGTAEQSYFADGMTESIITDLSRVGGLLVIARNTSFTFKDQTLDVQSVAQELGVRYVVEGSVQKAGEWVRINANLIDATSGYQVWADKLDRDLSDVFALQDEVTGRIVSALKIRLTQDERQAVAEPLTDSIAAYDLYLRAWQRYWQYNDQARREARLLLNQALAEDPGFARAQALLAMTYTSQVGASLDASGSDLDNAYEIARRAVALNEKLPQVHWVLALVQMFRKEYENAQASIGRAIELDPNFADAYALRSWILQYAGEPEQALAVMETAMRLNPRPPFPYLSALAETYFSMGRYEKAASISSETLQRNPTGQRLRLFMAASLAQLGRVEDAAWEIQELLLLEPGLTTGRARDIAPYRDRAVQDRLVEGLQLAGLPD